MRSQHLFPALLAVALAVACGRGLPPPPGGGVAPSAGASTLALELSFEQAEVGALYELAPRARLVNRGERPILVVRPGDGSECGWRTPVLTWSARDADGASLPAPAVGGRCGNRNALEADELVELAPGESVVFDEWLGYPPLPGPGTYRVALEYWNDPAREWRGLGGDDPALLARVRASTACRVRSAPVELVWRAAPGR